MFRGFTIVLAAILVIRMSVVSVAQESDLVQLQHRVELLELKLQLAEREAERLEKECEVLRKENSRLKGDAKAAGAGAAVAGAAVAAKDDPFQPGVVWVGEAINNDKSKTQWALSVSDRKGRAFQGAIAAINGDGNKLEFEVSGKAPEHGSGLVEFESPLIGRAKMFMRGTLRNGEIALAFSGTTRLGQKFFGSATLRPKH
ncbi:MAG: hypothetical protein KDB14_06975 [Planctomycetales bacterium]|nr:hypothetical protein [Planctomycetales bacterium]